MVNILLIIPHNNLLYKYYIMNYLTNNLKYYTADNIKNTLLYYFINPNVKYIKENTSNYIKNVKDDYNFSSATLNPIKIPTNFNKIKNESYDILTPHKIKLSSNKKYETKLKYAYFVCLFLIFIFFILYINN